MPIVPSSALTKFITALPDNWATKTSAVSGQMLKKVKQEELDYSGVSERLADRDPEQKVTKKDLLDWDANRADKFGEVNLKSSEGKTKYNSIVIPNTVDNTYEESVRKFNTVQEGPDFSIDPNFEGDTDLTGTSKQRTVSSHFDKVPNYFAHSRTSVGSVGGVGNTRIIQEIQSDLHQKGRVNGYQGQNSKDKIGAIPDAPLKKNWARKEIERQILKAVDEDQGAIAIPLESDSNSLARTDGVSKWYETQVRSTLKKLARQIPGAKYTEKLKEGATPSVTSITNDNNEVFDFVMENPDIARAVVGDSWDALDPDLADENSLALVNKVIDALMIVDSPDADNVTQAQFDRLITFMPNEGEVVFGQIILPKTKTKGTPEWTKKFEIYSAGALAVAAGANPNDAQAQEANDTEDDPVGRALSAKVSPGAILERLQETEGMDEQGARRALAASIQRKIDKAIEEGVSSEAIQERVSSLYSAELFNEDQNFTFGEVRPNEPESTEPKLKEFTLVPISNEIEAADKSMKELKAANENFSQGYAEIAKAVKESVEGIWDEKAAIRAENTFNGMNYHVANNLRSMGRDVIVEDGTLKVKGEAGEYEPINEDIWSEIGWAMAASENEIGMGMLAAYGTYKTLAPYKNFIKNGLGKMGVPGKLTAAAFFGLEAAGGALGVAAGRGLDLAYNSYTEKETVEAGYYKDQMIAAGVFDAIAGSALVISYKLMRQAVLATGRALNKAKNTSAKEIIEATKAGGGKIKQAVKEAIILRNRKGAFEEFKKYTDLSDSDIDRILTDWEEVTGVTLKGSRAAKAFEVIPQVHPNAQELVEGASKYSSTLTSTLAKSISKRAKDVISLAESASPDNIGIVIKAELEKFESSVKGTYASTKKKAIKEMPKSYSFNYAKVNIKPLIKEITNTVTNQDFVAPFLRRMERFEKSNSFSDLLDLKRDINDLKYNSKIRRHVDREIVNNTLQRINKEIASAASNNMKDGDAWLKSWKEINQAYSNMIVTKKNVLFKAVTKATKNGGKQGQNTKTTIAALSKHVDDIDGTFLQVVSKLPDKARNMAESTIMETIVAKYTAGTKEGVQAIDFPALSAKLKGISFNSTEARRLKRSIRMLSEVYKNDLALSRLSTGIRGAGQGQTIATTIEGKMHMAFINRIWGYIQLYTPKMLNPDKYSTAMRMNIERVLRNPKDAKSVNSLVKMFPKDDELADGIRQLALQSAKFGEPENYPYVQISKIGSPTKVRDGKLGKGVHWSSDTNDIKHRARFNKLKVSKMDILPDRIATEADVKSILKNLGLDESLINDTAAIKANQRAIYQELDSRGYEGFAIGHDILIFQE